MKAYSCDLRARIVAAVERGTPASVVARMFQVGPATVRRYVARQRQQGTLAPTSQSRRSPKIRPAHEEALRAELTAYPDATLAERCERWAQTQGQRLSRATMCRSVARLGWTRKKNGCSRRNRTR